jgi:endo-1,4-beta-xylanase
MAHRPATTVNQWAGGLQGQVTVTDSGAAAIGGWTVALTLPGGETITQTWNATLTQSGASAAAVNLSWNGSLPPGGSTAFGFLASFTGSSAPPTVDVSLSDDEVAQLESRYLPRG